MLDPTQRSAAYTQWRMALEGVGTLPRPLWAVPRVDAEIGVVSPVLTRDVFEPPREVGDGPTVSNAVIMPRGTSKLIRFVRNGKQLFP